MKSFFRSEFPTMRPSSAGFGAIFNNSLNICEYHYKKYKNLDFLVQVDEISDLFNTPEIKFDSSDYTTNIESEFMSEIFAGTYDVKSNAHMVCNNDFITEKNEIYNKFFSLKNSSFYESILNDYIDSKTLSIHLRGTDKSSEVGELNLENVKKHIEKMTSENDIEKIFISTDDIKYIDFINNNFSNYKIVYTEKNISKDGRPIHFDLSNRKKLNQELMIDVYLLSKSKYFLYCFSNVSYLALIMGIHDFDKIDCVNI
jgi:hypothetical protein